jgi:hypothetical protein
MTARIKIGIAAVILVTLSSAIALSPRASSPQLTTAVVSTRTATGGFIECVVGLTNSGGPVSYTGYAKDSPLYSFIYPSPDGSSANPIGWCGTGLGRQTLTKGEGVQFKTHFHSTNPPTYLVLNYQESRLLDRLLAHGPRFIRSQIQPRQWQNLHVPLSNQ